ncbi:hypothetical protein [Acidiluteibacter ferrifornacis]|jgi:hypothetical protein|uniref:Lipoprotein n=1 Tax=Acidiluteibacter ferrifornacis TaxID=2692424 RepID=A0A6N9NH36_9FLAO|nr:hypothetical protein [Acidiluteibacter ferrifornacis]MBR9833394.1 hypothetical protein [bacterium]NBG64510.1 hypothetical protein [Acidiluteibacter ferrifornacis]
MRSITFCFFFIFLITSCEREDLLEGVSITPSIYEDPYLCCVSVRDVRQVSCDRIGFYVDVDLDSIPDDIGPYHIKVEDPYGKIFYAGTRNEQYASAICDTVNTYRISIYTSYHSNESKPYYFKFETKK